jgi:L-serine 3-dehydrogenase (NAD+)
MSLRIAFIGLGNMGLPMALNLCKASFELYACDLQPEALAAIKAHAQGISSRAIDSIQHADIVISMLPAAMHVEQLYLGQQGVFAQLKAGTLIIDCSTTGPDCAKRLHMQAEARGLEFLDAPVSGGIASAHAASLTFMVGGTAPRLERARPVLSAMGKQLFLAGGAGAGQLAKLCNNQLLAIQMAGTAEVLALGAANGLDPAVLSQIMQQSSGNNWVLERYNPWPSVQANSAASRDYQPGFMSSLMVKDLNLAQQVAQLSEQSTPMGALALQLYRLILQQDKGDRDFAIIQKLFCSDVKHSH